MYLSALHHPLSGDGTLRIPTHNSYTFITMASGLAIGIRISLGGARYPDPCRLDRVIARELTTQ